MLETKILAMGLFIQNYYADHNQAGPKGGLIQQIEQMEGQSFLIIVLGPKAIGERRYLYAHLSVVIEHGKHNHLHCSASFPMASAPASRTPLSSSLSNSMI